MTSTPTAALDADLKALREATVEWSENVLAEDAWHAVLAAESRLRSTLLRLQGRVEALEQERDVQRATILRPEYLLCDGCGAAVSTDEGQNMRPHDGCPQLGWWHHIVLRMTGKQTIAASTSTAAAPPDVQTGSPEEGV